MQLLRSGLQLPSAWYAQRAKSHKVEVSGASHSVYVSPSTVNENDIAEVIPSALQACRKRRAKRRVSTKPLTFPPLPRYFENNF